MVFCNIIVLTEVLNFSSSSLFLCEKLVQVVYWKESDKLLVIGLPEEKWVANKSFIFLLILFCFLFCVLKLYSSVKKARKGGLTMYSFYYNYFLYRWFHFFDWLCLYLLYIHCYSFFLISSKGNKVSLDLRNMCRL